MMRHERDSKKIKWKNWIPCCKGEAHESWKTMGAKGVHFFTLIINFGRLYENLNKTQMIRHRILGDLLGAGLVLDLMPWPLTFHFRAHANEQTFHFLFSNHAFSHHSLFFFSFPSSKFRLIQFKKLPKLMSQEFKITLTTKFLH